jgi:autotransporter-associated beta strand protein
MNVRHVLTKVTLMRNRAVFAAPIGFRPCAQSQRNGLYGLSNHSSMKKTLQNSRRYLRELLTLGSFVWCLLFAFGANHTQAALAYWNPQGTNGTDPYTGNMSGTWENSLWSTASGGSATPTAWVEGNAAVFAVASGAGTPAFTVTMNNNHTVAGVFDGPLVPDPVSVTITGSGIMTIPSGLQGFFVTSDSGEPGTITIENVIAGSGTLAAQGNGQLYLNGANTYVGGTDLGYSGYGFSGIIYFNNGASFGTGSIAISNTTGSLMVEGTSAITIANRFVVNSEAGTSLNVVGNVAGVTFSGAWGLGTNSLVLASGGASGDRVTISGIISASGGLIKSGAGILGLSGVNAYSGATTITAGTLQLGVANAIASSSGVVMSGGTLNPGSFNQAMRSTTLGLAANSVIDFGAGAATLIFANSSSLSWSSGAVLDLVNWSGVDTLQVGSDDTGLTAAQLGNIEFNGGGLGTAEILANGDVVQAPEPSMLALGLFGGFGVLCSVRRRKRVVKGS